MYNTISVELIGPGQAKRFLGERTACRFCRTEDLSAFGKRTNAHTFPAALGNRTLFSLDECMACNDKFSVYEDALSKAVGPFLTLGGVKGRNGVRNTGLQNATSKIRHAIQDGKRHLSVTTNCTPEALVRWHRQSNAIHLKIPIDGDKFVPLYAYKSLLKMAMALLPNEEMKHFNRARECLQVLDNAPHYAPPQVGFSYAFVGNAPPTMGGVLLRRSDETLRAPYMLFLFLAGSVCFQIWVQTDDMDGDVQTSGRLGIEWVSQLLKPEGTYHAIRYSQPLQFWWGTLTPTFQPFEAFELTFNCQTTEGSFTPIPRHPPN